MAVAMARTTALRARASSSEAPKRSNVRLSVPPHSGRAQVALLATVLAAGLALQPTPAEAGVQLQKVATKKVLQGEKTSPAEKKKVAAKKKVSSSSSLSAPDLSAATPLLGGLVLVSVGAAAVTVIPKIDLGNGGDLGEFLNEAMSKDVSGYAGNEVVLKEGGTLAVKRTASSPKKGKKGLFGK